VLELIDELGVEICADMANLLAMGIMTDTGNFRHKNVTENTLYSAGKMVEKGADLNNIYYHMFSAQTKNRAKLFGKTMQNIRYFFDGRFAVATVKLEDFDACNAEQSETEGFIDFVMGIIGVEIGACVMETQKNKFKISFRSKSADVNAVAGYFGGGGHTLASGCQIHGDYEEVIDKITFAVKRELPDCL
jgi:phosphoesterase RecJ-like protein